MPSDNQFQPAWGTVLATFTQTGTFSAVVPLSKKIVALYSDNYPAAAGSIVVRASVSPTGTGWPVQTGDGTALKVLAFGSGTYYSFNSLNAPMPYIPYAVLQIGTAGTAGVAAGGTVVIVTGN
jgi:hypothetical protein